MSEACSVVVALDGESKCGKTTIASSIATEAIYQAHAYDGVIAGEDGWDLTLDQRQSIQEFLDSVAFNRVSTISAGNSFRAATLYVALLELQGQRLTQFTERDVDGIREVLAVEGVEEALQNDQNIANGVADVAKLGGAQAVCSSIFCDFIKADYSRGGGGNLVIIDARDPVSIMYRNKLIGFDNDQVSPACILPVYIDTTPETAARRMSGDYQQRLIEVRARRHADATRPELPVVRPADLIEDYNVWITQFASLPAEVVSPLRLDNNAMDLDNVQYLAGQVAMLAHDVALTRQLV